METFATTLCILLTAYGVQASMSTVEAASVASIISLFEKRGYNSMNSSTLLETKITNSTSFSETLGNSTLTTMNETLVSQIETISEELDALVVSSSVDVSSCIPSLTNATATATEIVANATTCWNNLITELDSVNKASLTTIADFISDWDDPMTDLYTCYTADPASDMECLFDLQDDFNAVIARWYTVANLANTTMGSYLEFLVGVPSCNYAAEIATLVTYVTDLYNDAVNCTATLEEA